MPPLLQSRHLSFACFGTLVLTSKTPVCVKDLFVQRALISSSTWTDHTHHHTYQTGRCHTEHE